MKTFQLDIYPDLFQVSLFQKHLGQNNDAEVFFSLREIFSLQENALLCLCSREAFLIIALLGLAARLRWKANRGKGLPGRPGLSHSGRVTPRALPSQSFLPLPASPHWSVSSLNDLAPLFQSFYLTDKGSDRATTPKGPTLFTAIPRFQRSPLVPDWGTLTLKNSDVMVGFQLF